MASDSMTRSRKLLGTTSDLISDMGWKGFGQSIIGTVVVSITLGGLDLFNALLGIPMAIFNTLASLIPALNEATFGGIAGFIGAGIGAGASAFGSGWVGLLGILQAPVGVAVGLIMLWQLAYYLDLTDRDFLGFAMDVPDFFLNNDDSGVANEDE